VAGRASDWSKEDEAAMQPREGAQVKLSVGSGGGSG
jgi:hypothetical protein